jgi:hypothetical protein
MNKTTLYSKLATIILLVAFLTQMVSASGSPRTRAINSLSANSFSENSNIITNTLSNFSKPIGTQELPKGSINPSKINKGERNKAVAFISPQCNDKWKNKKLKIIQEDKERLAKNGIEISENMDFLESNFSKCKAISYVDIDENAKPDKYKIRFFPDNVQNEFAEVILEIADNEAQQTKPDIKPAATGGKKENGITIGQPKQFDERTLTLMLQSLESKLAQSQFPDTSGLYGSVGKFGGATANTTSMALSARGPSTSSVVTTLGSGTKETTNGSILQEGTQTTTVNPDGTTTVTFGKTSNTNGTTGETTNNSQQVITQPGFAPPTAGLPGQTSIYSYQPQFGIASQDLLAEQTSLFYQIANLRLLLDRSLTDRIKVQDGDKTATDEKRFAKTGYLRDQVVIGFQISIDAAYKDAVAEAEVTIDGTDVSLVSLLPQEKTYNVAAVTKDSKAIDVGAVVQFIGVGAAAGKTQESIYLVKDTDTVALERKSTGSAVKFAWQFRPVLGRKTVEPGVRQVYALVSVPNIVAENNGAWTGKVTATTRWRRYDKKTKTVGDVIKETDETSQYADVNLPIGSANLTDSGLKPNVRKLSYNDVGNGQVLMVAEGDGFTRDTNVILGNKLLIRPEDGLTIANERRLMILATGQSLVNSSPLLVSRYGTTSFERLRCFNYPNQNACINVDEPYFGRRLEIHKIKARDSLNSEVTIRLISDDKMVKDNSNKDVRYIENFEYLFENHPPVVIIGNKVFGFSDAPFISKKYKDKDDDSSIQDCGDKKWCADLTFVAPSQLLANNTFLTFKEFLWNKGALKVDLPPQNSFTVSELKVLGSNSDKTQLAIFGGGFTKKVRVFVGNTEFGLKCEAADTKCIEPDAHLTLNAEDETATLITLSPTKSQIKDVKLILVMQNSAQPQALALAPPPPTVPKAKIISPFPLTIPSGDARREKLEGADLESIKKITTLDGKELIFKLEEKDKTILFLEIPEFFTAQAGEKQIKLIMKDDEVVFFTIVVKK